MNHTRIDPDAIDLDWYAVDSDGHLGHFTSGGSRVVPRAVLMSKQLQVELHQWIRDLPHSGAGKLTRSAKYDCSSFKEMAVRGLFSYDFNSPDNSYFEKGHYELIAEPSRPLLSASLRDELRQSLARVTMVTVCFAKSRKIARESIPGL